MVSLEFVLKTHVRFSLVEFIAEERLSFGLKSENVNELQAECSSLLRLAASIISRY